MFSGLLIDPRLTTSTRWLSDKCCLSQEGDLWIVSIAGAPLFRFAWDDVGERRAAAAMLAEAKAARTKVVEEVFEIDDSTLWRARRRLREGGVGALAQRKRGPKGPSKLKAAVVRRIVELSKAGASQRSIARRVGVSTWSVGRVQREQGLSHGKPRTASLPWPLASSEEKGAAVEQTIAEASSGSTNPEAVAADDSASTREEADAPSPPSSQEAARLHAALGLGHDGEAEVVLEPSSNVAFAGLLLVLPVLAATGLLDAARKAYGRLRPGIYGLRATILTLLFLAFLRRPQTESLKGTDPRALGEVLGLLRAPEVKTVRRKLREIGEGGKAYAFLRELATRWLNEADDALGLLYIDGHVRVYNGKHKLPKAHVTQKSLCLRATTDYWVNAVDGQPLFVVTAQANAHMTKVLPDLLFEIDALRAGRRGTVVFDRGGWSLKLFQALCFAGWDFLTYRKGKRDLHPAEGFSTQSLMIDGREVTYTLSERLVTFKNGLELREIAELRDDGGQTILVTTRRDDPAVLLAHRMFQRWRQENYFKYMGENFALDALASYGVEPDDPMRDVPNPARKLLDKKLAAARAELAKLEQEYGSAAIDNEESRRPTMRGFKIANGRTGKRLRTARTKIDELKARRREVPKRVPVGDVLGADAVVRLEIERKLFTDLVKATAYRAETTLHSLLRPHLKTADKDGRAFLRAAVRQTGALLVDGDDVTVRLDPMSAPRYTNALRALCEELNNMNPVFPETRYRLRYEVAPHPTSDIS